MTPIQIWKNASEIYANLTEMTLFNAMAHVNELPDLSVELKQAVITLIHAGHQNSQYFEKNIATYFNPHSNSMPLYKSGQHLDEYELLTELGQGGMSQVFMARRTNAQQQTNVALKIFSPKQGQSELLKHFIREQKILSQLSHPHIVKMLHSGHTKENVAYLVMELVSQAQPIDAHVKSKALNDRSIVKLIHQCADALSYSHANLIIHRDLKPDNILINSANELKIIDFGIAKLMDQGHSNNTTLLALTPSYAAPEQINAGQISVKTDVFSLAVVALELLGNKKPLPNDRLLKSCATDEEHIHAVIKSLTVDKDLKNTLQKAMQQQPEQRYETMNQFAQDLQAWLNYEAVTATGNSLYYQLSKFAQRRKALFASLMTLAVTLVFSIAALSWQYQQTLSEKQKAVEINEFMLNLFAAADPENNTGSNLSALDLLHFANEQIAYEKFSDLDVKSDILTNIGTSLIHLGSGEKGEKLLQQAIESNPDNGLAQLRLAQFYINQTQLDKAQQLIDRLGQQFQNEDESFAMQLKLVQGHVLKFRGHYQQALDLINTAREWFISSKHYLDVLKSTTVLSHIYHQLDQDQRSINAIESTLIIVNNQVPATLPALLRLQIRQAKLYGYFNESEKAVSIMTSTLNKIEEKLGKQHPLYITALSEKANILKDAKKFQQALEVANESYAIAIQKDGKNSALAQNSLYIIATIQYAQGFYQKSLENFEQILKLSINYYGRDHYISINVAIGLSDLYFLTGQTKKAIAYAKKLHQRILDTHGLDYDLTYYANTSYLELFIRSNQVNAEIQQLSLKNYEDAVKHLNLKHPQSLFAKSVLEKIMTIKLGACQRTGIVVKESLVLSNNFSLLDLGQ